MPYFLFFFDGFSVVLPAGFGWLEYEVGGRLHYTVSEEDGD